ncbi:MAG: cobalamin-binding protein, partial [Gammaproteobacteria bacterium]|nr:cobalamin-binding protein [Gammaproteobacteria bacterium]
GTGRGDVHDIGKNLCNTMLEGAGFEVIDLGANVAEAAFVEAVRQNRPQVVGMSALLTTTAPMIRSTIAALQQAGLRDSVRIMVGGAAVTEDFSRSVGADGFAPDASAAVRITKQVLGLEGPLYSAVHVRS